MDIIISIGTFLLGGVLAWLGMRYLLNSKYETVLREAEKEAEVIKKNKLLEVKEKFLHLKADLEKQVSARNAKVETKRVDNKSTSGRYSTQKCGDRSC